MDACAALAASDKHKSSFTGAERRNPRRGILLAFEESSASCPASLLASLFNRISLVGPIRAEIVGQIEDLHVGKAHLMQFCECGPEIRTANPGAAPAIEHNQLLPRERAHAVLQLLESSWLRTLAHVFRSGDVSLRIEQVRADLQDEGFVRAGGLQQMAQRFRLKDLGYWNCERASGRDRCAGKLRSHLGTVGEKYECKKSCDRHRSPSQSHCQGVISM